MLGLDLTCRPFVLLHSRPLDRVEPKIQEQGCWRWVTSEGECVSTSLGLVRVSLEYSQSWRIRIGVSTTPGMVGGRGERVEGAPWMLIADLYTCHLHCGRARRSNSVISWLSGIVVLNLVVCPCSLSVFVAAAPCGLEWCERPCIHILAYLLVTSRMPAARQVSKGDSFRLSTHSHASPSRIFELLEPFCCSSHALSSAPIARRLRCPSYPRRRTHIHPTNSIFVLGPCTASRFCCEKRLFCAL